jgi:enoyl-CoA hydratase/carnithine racemase
MTTTEALLADEVLYDLTGHIATITLNAPERMNTISSAMLDQLCERLLQADRDPAARCIVLTGAGRAFCAGLDMVAQMSAPKGALGGLSGEGGASGELDLRFTPPTVLHQPRHR